MANSPSTSRKKFDAVIIGFGWTGAIMAQELTKAGLDVLALERGPMHDTPVEAKYPEVADELTYAIRGKLFQPLARETVTVRHTPNDVALPYRQHGSFLLGNGVGGAGFHWNGMHWRALETDLALRTHMTERYGESFIPEDMTIQDYPVTYSELEPFFDHFEHVCGVSGSAGNVMGQIRNKGNPFEAARSREYPLAPLMKTHAGNLFEKAAASLGYHPFPIPASNASEPYTNPYGVRLGPCNFCGFCERFGCFMYSKASPQTTILPALMRRDNFELRTNATVLKILTDKDTNRAVGVNYMSGHDQMVTVQAGLVIVAAYQLHNVRLLLLSGIGQPYDPVSGKGTLGRNYAYQTNSSVNVVLPEGTHLNKFAGAGAAGMAVDDFNSGNFDATEPGFVGGGVIWQVQTGGRPIGQAPLMPDSPTWGAGWKKGIQQGYQRITNVATQGSVMSYRDAYLDLDPTYQDSNGQPLLRMTFDWHDNEYKATEFLTNQACKIAGAMGGKVQTPSYIKRGDHYDVRPYQSTHTTGGAIMGSSPENSVVNRYLQCWDVPNVFVMGASAFPQNLGYNPTGLVGALAYWSANAIVSQYLQSPGPLVQA